MQRVCRLLFLVAFVTSLSSRSGEFVSLQNFEATSDGVTFTVLGDFDTKEDQFVTTFSPACFATPRMYVGLKLKTGNRLVSKGVLRELTYSWLEVSSQDFASLPENDIDLVYPEGKMSIENSMIQLLKNQFDGFERSCSIGEEGYGYARYLVKAIANNWSVIHHKAIDPEKCPFVAINDDKHDVQLMTKIYNGKPAHCPCCNMVMP